MVVNLKIVCESRKSFVFRGLGSELKSVIMLILEIEILFDLDISLLTLRHTMS